MVTRCMEQEFPDHVAIRYVAEDGKTVVEKKYREYAHTILLLLAPTDFVLLRRTVVISRSGNYRAAPFPSTAAVRLFSVLPLSPPLG